MQPTSVNKICCTIHRKDIYPVHGVTRPSNNWAQAIKSPATSVPKVYVPHALHHKKIVLSGHAICLFSA